MSDANQFDTIVLGAGAAGLLKVMLEAATRASAPNAQLRVVNQHVDELIVGSRGAALLGLASSKVE